MMNYQLKSSSLIKKDVQVILRNWTMNYEKKLWFMRFKLHVFSYRSSSTEASDSSQTSLKYFILLDGPCACCYLSLLSYHCGSSHFLNWTRHWQQLQSTTEFVCSSSGSNMTTLTHNYLQGNSSEQGELVMDSVGESLLATAPGNTQLPFIPQQFNTTLLTEH